MRYRKYWAREPMTRKILFDCLPAVGFQRNKERCVNGGGLSGGGENGPDLVAACSAHHSRSQSAHPGAPSGTHASPHRTHKSTSGIGQPESGSGDAPMPSSSRPVSAAM